MAPRKPPCRERLEKISHSPRGEVKPHGVYASYSSEHFSVSPLSNRRWARPWRNGEYIQDLTEFQDDSGKVISISGIAVAGDFIYIVCHGSAEIRKFDVGSRYVEVATVVQEGTRPLPFHTGLSAGRLAVGS